MKWFLWGLLIAIILATLGFGTWYFFIKKSPEGGKCRNTSECEVELKCASQICTSGKVGSVCAQKTDCNSGYCVNSTCTEGKIGNTCATYKDCDSGLLCTNSVCAQKPDYSKYFNSVNISKMKSGMLPGPDNPLTPTTTFSQQDSIEVDFVGVKSTTVGLYYYELINSTTGEMGMTSKSRMETKFSGRDTGSATDLSGLTAGEYDLNIYYQDELVYSTPITIQ